MIDFGSNEEFIENYKELKSSRKMGEKYGCTKNAVLNHAKKIGYDISNNKEIKLPLDKKEEIIAYYEQCHNLKMVGEKYRCSSTAVANFFKKINYQIDTDFYKKISNISKEEFIESYEKLKSAKRVGEKYKCSSTAVLNYAKKIGYNTKSNKIYKLSQEDKQYIINSYNEKTSVELSKEFNVSRGIITKLWFDNNLSGKEIINPKTTEKNISGQKFGKWTVLYKTKGRSKSGSILWHCKCECGIERDIPGNNLRSGISLSCGSHSNISKGNEKIKQILNEANIPFEIEKKFETCIDINSLPFDFYINNSYLIEYDGKQHFMPIGENDMFNYSYVHYHDIIKNKWCKNNNIPLIRIPYTHLKDLTLNDLLLETSNFITK